MRHAAFMAVGLFALLLLNPVARGDDKPAADAPKPAISIGEMRIQTVPAVTYLCTPAETTFAKMGEPVQAGFDRVFAAALEAKFLLARPTMLVYQDNPHFHPTEPFKMEIGVIVADDAQIAETDDLTIRKMAPLKCATILYTGPVTEQGQAYQKLIPAMRAAGLKPTGEERELCLLWEGAESSSNIFMMMVGIE